VDSLEAGMLPSRAGASRLAQAAGGARGAAMASDK
jgi:hypothetical protein